MLLGVDDPILDIAKGLEKEALEDSYFMYRESYILMLIFTQESYTEL